jgi:hypothetical protein
MLLKQFAFRVVNAVAGTICLTVLLSCTEPPDNLSTSPEKPTYSIEGATVEPDGVDTSVSLLASVRGDLNDDGLEDLAAILVHDSDGTGVFYYLNVFVGAENRGWRLIGEKFLGDRVKFDMLDIYSDQSVSSITGVKIHPDDYGMLFVAYFTHTVEQSFVEEPALYITKHWRVLDERLVQI